jgi:hypothetical protein
MSYLETARKKLREMNERQGDPCGGRCLEHRVRFLVPLLSPRRLAGWIPGGDEHLAQTGASGI